MVRLDVSLLGPTRCVLNGQASDRFGYDRVRALLFYLLVENGRPHRREALAGLLWLEQDEAAARHSLSHALPTLRSAIDDRSAESPLLLVERDTIEINRAASYTLDVTDFLALITACEEHTHDDPDDCSPCARRLEQAVERYRGAFLGEFILAGSETFREWQITTAEQFQRRLVWVLSRLIATHRRRNDLERAVAFAQRWADLDLFNEAAQRALIGSLAEAGDQSGALRQFERWRNLSRSAKQRTNDLRSRTGTGRAHTGWPYRLVR